MDLKAVFVLVCLFTLAIISTEAGIPKCCKTTAKSIPPSVLMRVQSWEVQQSSGACDIKALVLHVKNIRTPICANLKLRRSLIRLQWRMKRSKQRAVY